MSPIKAQLRRLVADGVLTTDELRTELEPLVKDLPAKASDDARAILDVWLNDELEIQPATAHELSKLLTSRGYPMPYQRPESAASMREQLLRGNVTETDQVFDALSKAVGKADATTVIAVLDSEFDLAHPALDNRVAVNEREVLGSEVDADGNGLAGDRLGFDFARGVADVNDPSANHGTHVMGIATRGTERLKAVPLKVWDGNEFDPKKCAEAIDYAVSRGAKVINLSLMTTEASEAAPLEAAIRRHPSVLFVLGAGNRPAVMGETERFTAETHLGARPLDNMVLVTGTNRANGTRDGSYPVGERFIDVVAPASVFSAVPRQPHGPAFRHMQGTSMSTPFVTSIVGKCLALDASLTPAELRALLRETCDTSVDWNGLVASGGPVNSDRAVRAAALGALVKSGMPVDAALDRIACPADERASLKAIAATLFAK